MARLKTLGFELQSTDPGVEYSGGSGSATSISTAHARSGLASMRVNAVEEFDGGYYVFRAVADNGPFYARVWVYLASLPTLIAGSPFAGGDKIGILSWYADGDDYKGFVTIDTTGKLRLHDSSLAAIGSASSPLSLNTWYCIETSINHSTTTVELKLNGVVVASSSSASTAAVTELDWGVSTDPGSTASLDIYFDDIAINDSTGSYQNGYPGTASKVAYVLPDSAGDANSFATQAGGTVGSANNYTRVDETIPNDATDYNGSSTLNQEDLFNCTDSGLGSVDIINVVEVHGRFRNSVADPTAALKLELEKIASGTKVQSSAIVPNDTDWATNTPTSNPIFPAPITAYADPDGIPWQKSALDTMQIGYKLTTGPGTAGRRIDVTKVWAVVDYVPGTYRASLIGLFD